MASQAEDYRFKPGPARPFRIYEITFEKRKLYGGGNSLSSFTMYVKILRSLSRNDDEIRSQVKIFFNQHATNICIILVSFSSPTTSKSCHSSINKLTITI